MGLFSSKQQTYVGTTVTRVMEDGMLPHSARTGTLKSLFADDDQIIENIMEELVQGIGVKADRMYDYAQKSYLYGLPSAKHHSSEDGKAAVKAVIEAAVGPVTLEYFHFGPLNNLHVAWQTLVEQHGYDAATNQIADLSTAKGKPVFLKDMVVVVSEATLTELGNGSLDQWGTAPNAGVTAEAVAGMPPPLTIGGLKGASPFEINAAATTDYVRVEYTWSADIVAVVEGVQLTRQEVRTDSFIVPITGFDLAADYYQVKYSHAGHTGYWTYKSGAGSYPTIDKIYADGHDSLGSFFPFGYLRYNKTAGNADKNSDDYKASKKLTKYLGINYDDLVNSVHENPDIKDVEQAMLMLAVPADTTDPLEQRYLFDFFDGVFKADDGFTDAYDVKPWDTLISKAVAGAMGKELPDRSIVIQDKRFKLALSFKSIVKRQVSLVIGKVGSHNSSYGQQTVSQQAKDLQTGLMKEWSTTVPTHTYRRQVTATLCDEVLVYGLRLTYYIYEGYNLVADENKSILMVPIDRSITQRYPIPVREILYARSLHYVFNSRQVVKIKWYQLPGFRVFLIVAAIVITIASNGATWQSIGASLAAGTLTLEAVVVMIVTQLLDYLVFSLLVKVFVRIAGPEAALILAAIAVAYGIYDVIDSGGISGAPWAKDLLKLSSNLAKNAGAYYTDAMKGLQKEEEAFNLFMDKEQKKLDDANKLLEHNNYMDPLIIFGESPKEFYQRTVHSGNIGVLSLDAISNYVDISLTLPKLNDTVGD